MARFARIVVPGIPHLVTQRGNRRMETFFSGDDYGAYLSLLAESSADAGCDIWAYCLMPNHVHLVMVPGDEDALRAALGETHRRYTRRINLRQDWQGHLWQERFHSFPMDEDYLQACVRYVEQNPVRAGLVAAPGQWRWSSAKAHLAGADDDLVSVTPLLERVTDWSAFLGAGLDEERLDRLRQHGRTGRPLGGEPFLDRLETLTGRLLRPGRPGPK